MNCVQLVGRLTATPELKQTQSGIAVTRFTVAVDRRFQKNGEEKQADFIGCVAWRQTAEFICKYFTKGQRIGIEGRITTGKYEAQDGHTVFTFDVDVNNAEFVDSKGSSTGGNDTYRRAASPTVDAMIDSVGDGEVDDSDSKLPF